MKEKNGVDTSRVTRVEVIDDQGRAYTMWDNNFNVTVQMQDDNRTLKIFVKAKDPEPRRFS